MKRIALLTGLLSSFIVCNRASSITPDGSLSTQVTSSDHQNFTITNGRTTGANLFHSFREFSIPTGGSATFDLMQSPNITTIFSRVTGGTLSNLDGLLQTINHTQPVSLFLVNPNGILFGANAKLAISGSFVASTAQGIQFADGFVLNTTQADTPLLTISAPIGLQFGSNSSSITVQNTGHSLNAPSYFDSVDRSTSPQGLAVQPGNTIALLANTIQFNGGILTAEQGHLEIGSIRSGTVQFNLSDRQFTYSSDLAPVTFKTRSLLDVSGHGNGSIQVTGQTIHFSDGSLLFSENQSSQPMGTLKLQATGLVEMLGMNIEETIGSGMLSEADSTGTGSDLIINAGQLDIWNGAQVLTRSYADGKGGTITVNITDRLRLIGLSATKTTSNIVTNNFAGGASGDIHLTAASLFGIQGGYIGSAPFPVATGRAGDINLQADDIEFSGFDPVTKQTSGMGSITFGFGDAGNLTLTAKRLRVADGAILDTSTYAHGEGGRLVANVSESITIRGKMPDAALPSFIGSKAPRNAPELQALFGLPEFPTGNPGNVIVNTNRLEITDGGTLNVASEAQQGDAGSIEVNARSILLDRDGSISATTATGNGGNIVIRADLLKLRRGSALLTETTGTGRGGNITIEAPVILGLENSDIIANAVENRGGNISLSTELMLGLKFRDTLNPRDNTTNDITASSKFNLSGDFQVTSSGIDPNAGLIELNSTLANLNQKMTTACGGFSEMNRFIVTNRGGMPVNPAEQIGMTHPWVDLRSVSFSSIGQTPILPIILTEATTWKRDRSGKVHLIATHPAASSPTDCASINKTSGV